MYPLAKRKKKTMIRSVDLLSVEHLRYSAVEPIEPEPRSSLHSQLALAGSYFYKTHYY